MSTQFLESEVVRLTALLNERCVKYYDPTEVADTVEVWRDTLVNILFEFYSELEEHPMVVGTKVRMANVVGGIITHGIVSHNLALYESKMGPFDGLDHTPAIDRDQFADGPEGSAEHWKAKQAQATESNATAQRREALANLLFVRWFDANGNQICQGWHNAATVVSL